MRGAISVMLVRICVDICCIQKCFGGGGQHTTHKRGVCRYTTHVFHEQKHMNSDMKLSVTASDVCLV